MGASLWAKPCHLIPPRWSHALARWTRPFDMSSNRNHILLGNMQTTNLIFNNNLPLWTRIQIPAPWYGSHQSYKDMGV